MSGSYRATRATAVDARWPKRSPFSPQCPPRLWPSCAADGAIRTALALPLRGTSPCSSEPPEARTATRSLARTTHLPDLPASCWLRLSRPYSITSAAPLALTFVIVKVTRCRTGPSQVKCCEGDFEQGASSGPPGALITHRATAPRRRTAGGVPGSPRAVGGRLEALQPPCSGHLADCRCLTFNPSLVRQPRAPNPKDPRALLANPLNLEAHPLTGPSARL